MALPTVYDVCVPRDDVLQGSITESDFAADLALVLRAGAPEEYTDPVKFFANTYPTRGLKALLVNVCHRLNASSKQIAAIFRLDTNYGKGKTHDLVALRHAAKGRSAAWPWKYCTTRSGSRSWLHTSRIGSSGTPYVKKPLRIAGLRGRNLALIEHRILRLLAKGGVQLGILKKHDQDHQAPAWPLWDRQALTWPFRTARCHPGSSSSSPPLPTSTTGWHSRNYLPHFDAGQTIQHITYRLADALPQGALTRMQAQCEELELDDSGKAFELRKRIEEYLDAGYGSCVLQEPEIAQMIIQNWMHFDQQRYRLLAWVVMPNHVHVLIKPINEWPLHKIIATWKTYTGKRIREWKQRMDEEEMKKSQDGAWRSKESQDGAWRSKESQDGAWRSKECQDGAWRSKECQDGAWRSKECQDGAWRSKECQDGAWRSQKGTDGTWRSGGRIWQREYWDRYMRSEQHYWTTKAYIENNPVKAGLVTSPEQWPWNSAAAQKNVYSRW